MSADYKTRPWEAEGKVLEVLFGNGTVSVGGLRLGASVSLCLGELPEPQEVGAQVQQAHDAERVRLTFSRVASIDVVLKHLRALRWHLSHQCCACGAALEASGQASHRRGPAMRVAEVIHVAADGMLLAALIRLARREYDMASADLKVVAGLALLGVLLTLL